MDESSRIKKFESLRNDVENDNKSETTNEDLLENINKKIDDNQAGNHAIDDSLENTKTHLIDETGEFKNEYLDSFIQEVREYNMKKGVRENEDTKLDILRQLSEKQREKRASYIAEEDTPELGEKINPFDETMAHKVIEKDEVPLEQPDMRQSDATTQDIAKQVQELLAQEEDDGISVQNFDKQTKLDPLPEFNDSTIKFPKEKKEIRMFASNNSNKKSDDQANNDDLSEKYFEKENAEPIKEKEKSNSVPNADDIVTREKLLEETQKLKIQLDDYGNNLNDLNDGVDQNNKLLNVIITVLIIVLLGVIGLVVYWLVSGGII